jgi:hypothetical protein
VAGLQNAPAGEGYLQIGDQPIDADKPKKRGFFAGLLKKVCAGGTQLEHECWGDS